MPTRILFIEKDEMSAAVKALELAGYEIIKAVNAKQGLKKLREARPDLIILGNPFPKVNGKDIVLRIQQAFYLPVIVIGSRERGIESLELEADTYVAEPPNMSELVARVRSLLRRKKRELGGS